MFDFRSAYSWSVFRITGVDMAASSAGSSCDQGSKVDGTPSRDGEDVEISLLARLGRVCGGPMGTGLRERGRIIDISPGCSSS